MRHHSHLTQILFTLSLTTAAAGCSAEQDVADEPTCAAEAPTPVAGCFDFNGLYLCTAANLPGPCEVDWRGANGDPLAHFAFAYDGDRLESVLATRSGDGAEQLTELRYGDQGRLIAALLDYQSGTGSSRSPDADGAFDHTTTYEYDDATGLVSVERSEPIDPLYQERQAPAASYFEYADDGVLETVRRDALADGEVDDVATYHYDDQGRLTQIETRGNIDGTTTFAYDQCRLAEQRLDGGEDVELMVSIDFYLTGAFDGTDDARVAYAYDSAGNVTRVDFFDIAADRALGSLDVSYACW